VTTTLKKVMETYQQELIFSLNIYSLWFNY